MAHRTTSLGKLITYGNLLSVKQNQSPAWLFGPLIWGKLITYGKFLSVKQNLSPAWLLGPLAWGKLITYDKIFEC